MILVADRLLLDRWWINHVGHCCVLPFFLVLETAKQMNIVHLELIFLFQVLMIVTNNGREKKSELIKSERLWQAETEDKAG